MGTVALGIRHVLCTPLRVVRYLEQSSSDIEQRPIGVLYLDSREKGQLMSSAARSALEAVAGEAASAIESARLYREATEKARMERELQLAAEIQRALLPEAMQSGPHFDVAAVVDSVPQHRRRFLRLFQSGRRPLRLYAGDVAGKGPPAALLTAMIQGAFAAQVTSTDSPAALMAHINRTLIRRAIQSRFVTVMYGVLGADGRLTYCNAGHNPPILVGRNGVRRLETGGLILGLFPHATYEEETFQLEDGDTLVVFSDGVTEALNAGGRRIRRGAAAAVHRRASRLRDRRVARQDSGDGQEFRRERGSERRRDGARAAGIAFRRARCSGCEGIGGAGLQPCLLGGRMAVESALTHEEMTALFVRRQVAFDNMDADALSRDYADDCLVDSPAAGTLRGAAAVDRARRAWFEAFPDLKYQTERVVMDGNHVMQLLTLEGTDIGGFMGLDPSGKSFKAPAVFVYEFRDRKIVRETRIYDFTGVLMQIGLLKAKPA